METFMLAKDYDGQDVSGWLMSEKFDGCRCLWDGQRLLLSRTQKQFHAPSWFTAALPSVRLDGELFVARGFGAPKTAGIVRKKIPLDAEWKKIRFHVFDLPDELGTFAERIAKVGQVLAGNHIATAVEHFPVTMDGLRAFHASIIAGGGEASMLKHPECAYTPGRSNLHLKFFGDR